MVHGYKENSLIHELYSNFILSIVIIMSTDLGQLVELLNRHYRCSFSTKHSAKQHGRCHTNHLCSFLKLRVFYEIYLTYQLRLQYHPCNNAAILTNSFGITTLAAQTPDEACLIIVVTLLLLS